MKKCRKHNNTETAHDNKSNKCMNKVFKFWPTALLILIFQFPAEAAKATQADSVSQELLNWYNLDPETDSIYGIATERAYAELLKGKPSSTVIVAVIDSGIDIHHEDLKPNIWVNQKEIPGNGIDDDGNGYVDDVYGWNFLGNAGGENIAHERLEVTREFARLDSIFENRDKASVPNNERKDYKYYLNIRKQYFKGMAEAKETLENIKQFHLNIGFAESLVAESIGKEDFTIEELEDIPTTEDGLLVAKEFLLAVYETGLTKDKLSDYIAHYENSLQYHYNPEYDPRPLVGDDPQNMEERYYGNNDVIGPDAEHGTHVAGIIAGVRGNELGIEGIAQNVKIMTIRAVPDGDERDKDIANAIRYAVDNGAQIINMSFGKELSPNQKAVEEAIRYSEQKGVLLVHAAGNEGKNVDKEPRYPSNRYMGNNKKIANFINVGASDQTVDNPLVASFSNYGKKNVDVFAPGVDIYSTIPDNQYKLNSGTSMASPVVTGLAAMLMSYYPSLSAQQIKEIITKSVVKIDTKIPRPEDENEKNKAVKFSKLSSSGGIVNAYKAVKLAEEMAKE